jgi:secreted trypsin-like serine protease
MRLARRRVSVLATAALVAVLAAPAGAIVGGTTAPPPPWAAAIYLGTPASGHYCGGTLVRPTLVVTAATCVLGLPAPHVTGVVLGRANLSSAGGDDIPITGFVVHPAWNPALLTHDIAVIRLSRPATYTPIDWLRPGDGHYYRPGVMATVGGWGASSAGGSGGTYRQATVPILDDSACATDLDHLWDAQSQHVCAGTGGAVNLCGGDLGGPLVVAGPAGAPRLAGVAIADDGCVRPSTATVYSEVAAFSSFLELFAA